MQPNGGIGSGLTDEELESIHDVLYDKVYYGDDEIVYGEGPEALVLRAILTKVDNEAKARKLWWAR